MTAIQTLPDLAQSVSASLIAAIRAARRDETPYRHWTVSNVFPGDLSKVLRTLPYAAPDLHGVSGKRELHNDQRHYFDAATNARFPACQAVADAFQSRVVVDAIERSSGADLAGSYVRLEYAQDTDGFWLQPHTDLGVKRFTMLIYLAEGDSQADLGTDIYADGKTWAKRSAFVDNSALVFVPGDNTWHGLAPRPIEGVRKSVIMNYVTDQWRERGQLAYPETPVRA
ncbi:MAG: 2OG-Fe(II) oxygenase [Caulobacteraceae bacterium]